MTIVARLLVGWLCDRIGPRITFTSLLLLGSLPVMAIGLSQDFATFLLFRVLIGAIGASFVITQYHTSRMFASNCVGTANAMIAGWGNLGGVTQVVMPLARSPMQTVALGDCGGEAQVWPGDPTMSSRRNCTISDTRRPPQQARRTHENRRLSRQGLMICCLNSATSARSRLISWRSSLSWAPMSSSSCSRPDCLANWVAIIALAALRFLLH